MKEYAYKGVPITPAIIETITIELFNGKTIKRDDIVQKVLDYHIKNGGRSPEAQDFPRSIKKALSNMSKKDWATNKTYGYWEIHNPNTEIKQKKEDEETIETEIEAIPPHTTYGKGDFAVYFYYFPSYRKLSEIQGITTWPCKIGRTDRDPLTRVLSQASTALPEKPVIEFIIKTENSSLLETVIHSALKLQGKYVEDSPGSEWFDTNPAEVLDIVKTINAKALSS